MRLSTHDQQWALAEDGTLLGLSLGWDFCAEHEWGISGILDAFGMDAARYQDPLGMADRQIKTIPSFLQYAEFKLKPRDKRRKAYPVAMLWLDHLDVEPLPSPAELALCQFGLRFYSDTNRNRHPADTTMVTWDRNGFAILSREQDIAHLRQLNEAFLTKDIAIGTPPGHAFSRGGLHLMVLSQLTQEQQDNVLEADIARRKLNAAAEATGIRTELEAAGKRYYALSPDWLDHEQQEEVIFYLNPQEQRANNHGWFTADELRSWIKGCGPVPKDATLKSWEAEKETLISSLDKKLGERGIRLRLRSRPVWVDEARTVPGLQLRVTRDSQMLLPSGTYTLEQLAAKLDALPVVQSSEEQRIHAE